MPAPVEDDASPPQPADASPMAMQAPAGAAAAEVAPAEPRRAPQDVGDDSVSRSGMHGRTFSVTVSNASGGLSTDEIQRVLDFAVDAFIECSTKGPGSFESAVTFGVTRKGVPARIQFRGKRGAMQDCTRGVLKRLVFPDSTKASSVAAKVVYSLGDAVGIDLRILGSAGGVGNRPTLRPTLAAGVPTSIHSFSTTGPLPSDVVRRVLKRNISRFRRCYTSERGTPPSLQTKVKLVVHIARSGIVAAASVATSNMGLKSCISHVARRMVFPRAAKETIATQTLEFGP